jgi:hypothetical protein
MWGHLDSIFFRFQNQVLSCRNGSVLRYLSKLVLFLLILFLPVYYPHILDIWLLFYAIDHNFKSNRWIELKPYQKISEVFFYVRVNFQVSRCLERTCDIGQNRLYEFCYLLPFNLWTSYLTRILFLKGCDSLFWKFSSFTRIFNELKHNFQEWQQFINVSESFSYKDSLFILAT